MDAEPAPTAGAAGADGAGADDAGHRIYTPRFLRIYDPLVLGFYSRRVWGCPVDRLVEHYDRHIGRRHLDVGPGTGYFLERARLPADAEVTLLDPNPDVLAHAARRLAALEPAVVQADVREPLPESRPFDSAAMNYVLHCLPGPPERKAAAVANVAAVLAPEGVLFGATILGERTLHRRLGRAAMWDLNRRGAFDNGEDTQEALRAALADRFTEVTIEMVGSVAVFSAAVPRPSRVSLSAPPDADARPTRAPLLRAPPRRRRPTRPAG